jgi:hypothetical protein
MQTIPASPPPEALEQGYWITDQHLRIIWEIAAEFTLSLHGLGTPRPPRLTVLPGGRP